MPLSCVQEWRARTGSCWCVLGRPAKCRSPFRGKESQPSQTSSFTTFFLILLSAMNFGMILDLINATCHLLNWKFFWAHVYLQPLETLLIVCASQKLISKVKNTYKLFHQKIAWYCQEMFECQIFQLNYTVKSVHIKVATAVVSVAFIAASIIFYLLLLSGDVELNPGPAIFSVSFFLCFIGMTSVHLVHALPVIRQVMSDNSTTGEGATGSTSLPPSLSGNSDSEIAGIVTGVIGLFIAIAVFGLNLWKYCHHPV